MAKERKRFARSKLGSAAIFLLLLLFGSFMLLPLVYAVVNAFKPLNEFFLFPPRFFVRNPTTENFSLMLQLASNLNVPFSRYLFNSLFIGFVGTGIYIIIACLAAYPLAKYRFPGTIVFSQVIVWAILFRPEVTGIPTYIMLASFGMINTYFALLLPMLASTFGVFLMKQFIAFFPDDILEAARIDGAGEYRIFWRIVMPSIKPGWVTLIIFTFQNFWNATGVNYIYDESLKGLPTVLSQIASAGLSRAGVGAATALFLMIPTILIFVITQSSVMETMAYSGIKG